MSKDYRKLEGIINNASDQFKVAYDKGYKQGVADTKEDMKSIIENAERRGYIKAKAETTVTLDKPETNDYEKQYEGCDGCIFEGLCEVDRPCNHCKHNDCESYTNSYFIPKPCQHEWEHTDAYDSDGYRVSFDRKLCVCKKCGLLRIEV